MKKPSLTAALAALALSAGSLALVAPAAAAPGERPAKDRTPCAAEAKKVAGVEKSIADAETRLEARKARFATLKTEATDAEWDTYKAVQRAERKAQRTGLKRGKVKGEKKPMVRKLKAANSNRLVAGKSVAAFEKRLVRAQAALEKCTTAQPAA